MLELGNRIEAPEQIRTGAGKHSGATLLPPLDLGAETPEGPTVPIEDVPLLNPPASTAPAVKAAPAAVEAVRPRRPRLASTAQELCNPFDLVGIGLAVTAAVTIVLTFLSVLGVVIYLSIIQAPH